ncbi:MAG: flagellar motor protein [Acidocella sp. 20-63-7]|nr:MAG: flagellar motor protein [Acidocella sp. 20-63-7]HQT46489.1 flagellar motor protein [Acidocella sp.]
MTSLLGLFLGFAVIIGGALSDSDPLSSLFSLTAVIIVLGGSSAAILTQFGARPILLALKSLAWLVKPPSTDLPKFIDQVAEWSSVARSQGTLALESILEDVTDPFQKKGLQLIIDNTSPDDLPMVLGALAENTGREQEMPGEIWEAAGGYSPTIGVMGAVLGLIHVMMRLDHPEELGQGIATAFVATIYGVGFANLMCLPLGTRLKHLAKELERERHIVIQGFILLAQGKPGLLIKQNLQSFLNEKNKPNPLPDEDEESADAAPQAA